MGMVLKKGSRGDAVKSLQRGLAALGFHPGAADGVFGGKTEDAVEAFQEKHKLYADGVAGDHTIAQFNEQLLKYPGFEAHIIKAPVPAADPAEPTDRKRFSKCPADKYKTRGGYRSTSLRSDAAERYNAMYARVKALGGIITSAGGKRGLTAGGGSAQSKTSLHYLGLAFDMALPTGMQGKNDPYVICKDSETPRKWVVWCRLLDESAPEAHTVEEVELEGWYVTSHRNSKGKRYTQMHSYTFKGKAINVTAIAKENGWEPIRGRRSFFRGGSATGSEWWHFGCTALLEDGTTFGEELLKVYKLSEVKAKFRWWDKSKMATWGKSWFG